MVVIQALKSMRNYVLTDKERKILRTFIESDLKLNGFSVLMLRLRNGRDQIAEDLKLIDAALAKTGS